MTIARYFSFLLIGMFTSIVFMSMAFRIDFQVFVAEVFDNLSDEKSYAVASFVPPNEDDALVVLEEVGGIKVDSQITIHRNLANLVRLTGIVSEWQAYEAIEVLCECMFPHSKMLNEVQVFSGASDPTWLSFLEGMAEIEPLKKVRNANIAVSNDLIEMTGAVSSRGIREALLGSIKELNRRDKAMTFSAHLSVHAIAPELDLWMAASNTVLLQGALSSNAKDSLVAIINLHLKDGRRLVDSMEVNDDIQDPTWLGAVQNMVPDFLVNMTAEQLKVKDGSVVLKGKTGSQKIANGVASYLSQAFPQAAFKVENGLEIVSSEASGKLVDLSPVAGVASSDDLIEALESSTIYFGSGRTRLGNGDQRKLENLANVLMRDDTVKVEIVGHSDPSGDAEFNVILAERRCRSACDYLFEMGIDHERLDIKAVGSEGKTGGRSADQRRVEFRLVSNILPSAHQQAVAVNNATMIPATVDVTQEERWQRAENLLQTTQVFFDTARSTIKTSHKRELQLLAQHLKSLEEMPCITIRGLADPRGNAAYNRKLSRRRCEAVFSQLKSLGVDTSNFKLDERGATEADLNNSDALRQARRVEFSVERSMEVAA